MALDRGDDLRGPPGVGVAVAGEVHSQGVVGLELFQEILGFARSASKRERLNGRSIVEMRIIDEFCSIWNNWSCVPMGC